MTASDFFSSQKRGGVIASRIEHQDSVGVVLALEILKQDNCYSKYATGDWSVYPEGHEDLTVIFNQAKLFIQVKTAAITKKELRSILDKFYNNLQQTNKIEPVYVCLFRIHALGGFTNNLSEIETKLKELNHAKIALSENELEKLTQEFMLQYQIEEKYTEVICNLVIDTRRLYKASGEASAIFAQAIRKAYSIKDFGDQLIDQIYISLLHKFDLARLERKPIPKKDILYIIHKPLASNGPMIGDFEALTGYVLTEKGYEKNAELTRLAKELKLQSLRVYQRISKEWIGKYWKIALRDLLFGYWEICSICRHPLMGNTAGLKGIVCPDCGFQPYGTLVLGCKCGNYVTIKHQPALASREFENAVREYFQTNDSKCNRCGDNFLDSYWEFRLLFVPYPDPVDVYVKRRLSDVSATVPLVRIGIFCLIVGAGYMIFGK